MSMCYSINSEGRYISSFKILWIFIALMSFTEVEGQITANFDADKVMGCGPMAVTFTDMSIGSGIIYRKWDFGNGNVAIGNSQVASVIYLNTGFYDVSLTVSNGVDTNVIVKSSWINVIPEPVIQISVSDSFGCAPLNLQVFDLGVNSSVPVVGWEWDFKDGTVPDTNQNTSHTYFVGGDYFLHLKVTDSLGCFGNDSITFPITVSDPQAQFDAVSATFSCDSSLNLSVVNQSTGIGSLSSLWTLNAQVFTSQDLQTILIAPNNYDLELAITDSLGCQDTLLKSNFALLRRNNYTVSISDTVCPGVEEWYHINGPSGSVFSWDFGNGNVRVGNSVKFELEGFGGHAVKVYADDLSGCLDTITTWVIVDSVLADFSSFPHFSCQTPMVVKYLETSIGNIRSFEWDLGSGTHSMSQLLSDTLYSTGVYNDTLTVISDYGCENSIIKLGNDTLEITKSIFLPDMVEGCAPLTVNFQNLTANVGRIKRTIWNFDLIGGTIAPSFAFAPTHTFNNPGRYTVELEIILENGCSSTSTHLIVVGTKQVALFTIDTNYSCAGIPIGFTNLSQNSATINSYYWDFGDGFHSVSFGPNHSFRDTGYLDISLVVGYNGCYDTSIVDSAIFISGPVLNFKPSVNCEFPNQISFQPQIKGATDVYWDFGDGSPIDSSFWGVHHTYALIDSNYAVRFWGQDTISGCLYSRKRTVKIRFLEGELNLSDSIICRFDSVHFDVLGSSNATSKVRWSFDNFGSLVKGGKIISKGFSKRGSHPVYAIVSDVNGCRDTVMAEVKVFAPKTNWAVDSNLGCAPLLVNFFDSTQSDTNIVSWEWQFGDGTTSSIRNPIKTFTSNRNASFSIKLKVTDTLGCIGVFRRSKYIQIKKPRAKFTIGNQEHCLGDSLQLTKVPGYYAQYLWGFGDGSQSTVKNPSKSFSNAGLFLIDLVVTDKFGCADSFSSLLPVEVHELPQVNIIATDTIDNCYPASFTLENTNSIPNTQLWEWGFGDGSTVLQNTSMPVFHTYNRPGRFDVTLKVTTQFGCADSLTTPRLITVNGPTGKIVIQTNTACLKNNFEFGLTEVNKTAKSFVWDFGDGILDTVLNSIPNMTHTYQNEMHYTVTLLVSDSLGQCIKSDQVEIDLINVEASILMDDTIGCSPVKMKFNSNSKGANEYLWIMGNRQVSSDSVYFQNFLDSGKFRVTLIVRNDSLFCSDTAVQEFVVFLTPVLTVSPDTLVCQGDQIKLSVLGADVYQWNPGFAVVDSLSNKPLTHIFENTIFSVTGVNKNGCQATEFVELEVIKPPQLLSFPTDTSIFKGEELPVIISANDRIVLNWESNEFMSCEDCFDPYLQPSSKAEYTLVYSDEYYCFVQDTSFSVDVLDYTVFIPNSFSPNNDGLNDVFIPVTSGVRKLMYMYIYDNWGKLVFESTDLNQGWNGTINGKNASRNSMFVYKLKVIGEDSKTSEFMGSVMLLAP